MIEIRGFDAVICCDCCLEELAYGRFPHEAMDNLGPKEVAAKGHLVVIHDAFDGRVVVEQAEEIINSLPNT